MIIYYHKMENLITLDIVNKNEKILSRRIFTDLQLKILKKRIQKKKLNINERTYYYKYIKPKLSAMFSFFNINDIKVNGEEYILKNRIPKATSIINNLRRKHKNKRIMVSGSFLFNKNYNDIDIFIFTKYDKEDYKTGKIHVNFIPENAINSLFFSSLSKVSISNFSYTPKNEFSISLRDILQNYELLVNSFLSKEDYQKELRDFLVSIEYISNGVVLNTKQMYELRKKMKNIKIISNIFITSLILGYKKNILDNTLKRYITDYKKLLKQYNFDNLKEYIQTYEKVINLAM